MIDETELRSMFASLFPTRKEIKQAKNWFNPWVPVMMLRLLDGNIDGVYNTIEGIIHVATIEVDI